MKPLTTIRHDIVASIVVFFVALPLCLGIAHASGAPLISGILSGIIGGLLVGTISGSQSSVSGPAAGLTAIVLAQITALGSFETFLLAVVIAGVLQIVLGLIKAGALSVFFPSSVIKGLLAAIGIILILKQIPHLVGHDTIDEGDMSFVQKGHGNTFTEIFNLFDGTVHSGAILVGFSSLAFLLLWDKIPKLKKSLVPSSVIVVVMGLVISELLNRVGNGWAISPDHMVQVPIAKDAETLKQWFAFPNWSELGNQSIYIAAVTIAIVASLETLLNLEAVDKLDPQQRRSPPNRELIAQGIGNISCGLVGAIPLTSVVVRSSVNLNAGSKTKLSAILHGVLLLISVLAFPVILNKIPLACLAAILIVTGAKLANWQLFKQMIREGRYQAIPFFVTLFSIVLTDLLIGILIGLGVSVAFILYSNLRSPVRNVLEKQIEGDVLHIQLASQVSFLNRAALENTLYNAEKGTHVLINGASSQYIDPDIISLINDFRDKTAPAHGVTVSTMGFDPKFRLNNEINYPQVTTRELQSRVSPEDILEALRIGNERFRSGNRITRDLGVQVTGTSAGQYPLAMVLTCIDSRTPTELIFDMGIGDIFTARVAGNIAPEKIIGSMEYACAVAGAKLIVVLGHTQCGAVNSSVQLVANHKSAMEATGCGNLDSVVSEIQKSVDREKCRCFDVMGDDAKGKFLEDVTRKNVRNSMRVVIETSDKLRELIDAGKVLLVGALYDVGTGKVEFFEEDGSKVTV